MILKKYKLNDMNVEQKNLVLNSMSKDLWRILEKKKN